MTSSQEPASKDVQRLYTRRARGYVWYVQAFGHRQGLRAVLDRAAGLRPGQHVLDAGCGTGLSIVAVADAMHRRGLHPESLDAFDLTPVMVDRCRATLDHSALTRRASRQFRIPLRQADILRLDEQLPGSWRGYDLVICASMLEHLPRQQLRAAVTALRRRLSPGGRVLIVITRRLFYPTRWIWHCAGYSRDQLRSALADAGLTDIAFHHYPWAYRWLDIGNHVVTATAASSDPGQFRAARAPRRDDEVADTARAVASCAGRRRAGVHAPGRPV